MAFYTLQLASNEQLPMFRDILTNISSSEPDLIIVDKDGRQMIAQKRLFYIFSETFANMCLSLSSCSNDLISISVNASFETLSKLVAVLGAGKADIKSEEELLDIVEVAKMLGIDLENSDIEFSKSVNMVRYSPSKKREKSKAKSALNLEEDFIFNHEEKEGIHQPFSTMSPIKSFIEEFTDRDESAENVEPEVNLSFNETIVEDDGEEEETSIKLENTRNSINGQPGKSSNFKSTTIWESSFSPS